jgi:hypothetical protein
MISLMDKIELLERAKGQNQTSFNIHKHKQPVPVYNIGTSYVGITSIYLDVVCTGDDPAVISGPSPNFDRDVIPTSGGGHSAKFALDMKEV